MFLIYFITVPALKSQIPWAMKICHTVLRVNPSTDVSTASMSRTQSSDEFKETAASLSYCSYLPDYISGVQGLKRKADQDEEEEDTSKRRGAHLPSG